MIIISSNAHTLVMTKPTGKTANVFAVGIEIPLSPVAGDAGVFELASAPSGLVKKPLTKEASVIESCVDMTVPSCKEPEKAMIGARTERSMVLVEVISRNVERCEISKN